jgi:hypothetical protein
MVTVECPACKGKIKGQQRESVGTIFVCDCGSVYRMKEGKFSERIWMEMPQPLKITDP